MSEPQTTPTAGPSKVIPIAVGVLIVAAVGVAIWAIFAGDPTGQTGSGLGAQWQYNTENLRPIDASLLTWKQTLAFDSRASRPIGVAAGAEAIYVVDADSLRRFSRTGELLERTEGLDEPLCVAVGADGTVFVGLADGRIWLGKNGQSRTWPAPADKCQPTSIAVDGERVFVADAGNRIVWRMDRDGLDRKRLARIGRPDSDADKFILPSGYFDVAVAPDRMLRVVNPGRQRIEAWTMDGDREFTWGRSHTDLDGFAGCCNPANITILADGSVVTAEKGELPTVKVFVPDEAGAEANGKLDSVVASHEQIKGLWDTPAAATAGEDVRRGPDVAVDPAGRVVVLEPMSSKVLVFERK